MYLSILISLGIKASVEKKRLRDRRWDGWRGAFQNKTTPVPTFCDVPFGHAHLPSRFHHQPSLSSLPPPLSSPLSPNRVWICVNYGNQLRDDVRGMWLKALWLFKEIKKNGACVIRSATSHLALVRARIFTLDLLRIILCEYIIGGLCLIISYLNRLHIRLFWHGNFLPSWEYLFIV